MKHIFVHNFTFVDAICISLVSQQFGQTSSWWWLLLCIPFAMLSVWGEQLFGGNK